MSRVIEPEDAEGFNMTPMIDIVFQLIIFFMLVTDMAHVRVDQSLDLPAATKAMKDKMPDDTILVLNILTDGTIKIDGQTYFKPRAGGEPDTRKLEDLFLARRKMKNYQEVAGKDEWVKYPVLIRADRSAPFQYLQLILGIAAQHGGVTRVQLGAKKQEE